MRSLLPILVAALLYACLTLLVTNSYYQLMLTLVLVIGTLVGTAV